MSARHHFDMTKRARVIRNIAKGIAKINRSYRQAKPIAIVRVRGIGCRLVLP